MKRKGGMVDAETNRYLVLVESTIPPDRGWIHSCGTRVVLTKVEFRLFDKNGVQFKGSDGWMKLDVPYCPTCEMKPLTGTARDGERVKIYAWVG